MAEQKHEQRAEGTAVGAPAQSFVRRALDYVVLPKSISAFEWGYVHRLNRIAAIFFAMHIPVFTLIAFFNHTGPLLVAGLSTAVMAGPALIYAWRRDDVRLLSIAWGVVAMLMGGILVHAGAGPVQIEMHFYFFALIAMTAVFGNPMVVVAAAVTVAAHHLTLWALVPQSVFNYDAPFWVVAVHAGFVVLESVATVFIARSFFDNVIGLEKIVSARTEELRTKNEEMRLVLENIDQGLAICDSNLQLGSERSKTLSRWLKTSPALVDAVEPVDPRFANALALGWEQVRDGFLPTEVALDQLPREIHLEDGAILGARFVPIGGGEIPERYLLVVSDETARRRQQSAEAEARDLSSALQHMLRDRAGFAEFVNEANDIVDALGSPGDTLALELRLIHTLKGNAGLFGLSALSAFCGELEDRCAATDEGLSPASREELADRWRRVRDMFRPVLDADNGRFNADDVAALVDAINAGGDLPTLQSSAARLGMEPLARRFMRFGEQARQLARRLGRGDVEVVIDDGGVRLDRDRYAPLWASFAHLIRNAVDHGLESVDDRAERGAEGAPQLTLRARGTHGAVVVEIHDNGPGINWEKVAERARERDLPADSIAACKDALFADGFSTRDAVSDVSGRGVGLAAVRAAARDLGGSIDVDSDSNGTTFRITFPVATTVWESRAAC